MIYGRRSSSKLDRLRQRHARYSVYSAIKAAERSFAWSVVYLFDGAHDSCKRCQPWFEYHTRL